MLEKCCITPGKNIRISYDPATFADRACLNSIDGLLEHGARAVAPTCNLIA
jgi:hypothetical protein